MAKRLTDVGGLTVGLVGTIDYMAPERIEGKAERRSDIYSLGVVLFVLLTRRVPFPTTRTSRRYTRT